MGLLELLGEPEDGVLVLSRAEDGGEDLAHLPGGPVDGYVGVCEAVGVWVGVLLGVLVGVCVGVALGLVVGVLVGVSVGVLVGVRVGVSVGVSVTVGVGVTVGVRVGVGVGSTQHEPVSKTELPVKG